MTLEQFIESRIQELQDIMDDALYRFGGSAFNTKTYRSAKEIQDENKRLLAVLRGELIPGGRLQ